MKIFSFTAILLLAFLQKSNTSEIGGWRVKIIAQSINSAMHKSETWQDKNKRKHMMKFQTTLFLTPMFLYFGLC